MAALTARSYNQVTGEVCSRLFGRGQSLKQAMIACMRQLAVLMNDLVARKHVWGPIRAS